MLVSPVVEKGATSRRLYLPRGTWFDFWTEERLDGGREIDRAVDLATMPLHVRAGAVIPFGPVKQCVDEPVDAPLSVVVFPGANGMFSVRRRRQVVRYRQGCVDAHRVGVERPRACAIGATGRQLRMLPPLSRAIEVRVAGETEVRRATFTGKPIEIKL